MNQRLQSQLRRIQRTSLLIGMLALALCLVGAFFGARQFFVSYLFGYLFWLGLALGCFTVAMIHHLTGGRWGFPVRRFLEAGFATLPLLGLLFLPIFFGLRELYPWARPEEVAREEVLQKRAAYMNPWMFGGRFVFFFAIWILVASFLRRWSLEQDHTPDPALTRRLRALSGPGIVIYPLTGTFAYVDWILSLEREWYSTLFAVIVIIGQILVAYAFVTILLALFKNEESISQLISSTHFHHLGNLLLTFVMFWTYVAFGQLLIIYSGNLPQEIGWYLHRIAGSWKWIVVILALFHFFLPFFLLLFRVTKRRVAFLAVLASTLFLVHIVDTYWMVVPTFHQTGLSIHWLDFVAPVGVGGIWIAAFLSRLKAAALVPVNDPRLAY